MYDTVRSNNKTAINFADFDISTGNQRVVSQAYPININQKFIGAMFVESDL